MTPAEARAIGQPWRSGAVIVREGPTGALIVKERIQMANTRFYLLSSDGECVGEFSATGIVFHLRAILPETVLQALPGRRLSDLIDIAGLLPDRMIVDAQPWNNNVDAKSTSIVMDRRLAPLGVLEEA